MCASLQGLIQVSPTGAIHIVTNRESNAAEQPVQELMFTDDLDVASDGTVYFSTLHDVPLVKDKTGEYEPLRPSALNIFQVRLGIMGCIPLTQPCCKATLNRPSCLVLSLQSGLVLALPIATVR